MSRLHADINKSFTVLKTPIIYIEAEKIPSIQRNS